MNKVRWIPFIKFPCDWEIQFLVGNIYNRTLLCFNIKKVEAPNVVFVIITDDDSELNWELAVQLTYGDGSLGVYASPMFTILLDDVDSLIHKIEECLYTDDLSTGFEQTDFFENEY